MLKFDNRNARAFTLMSVVRDAPAASGVYVLSNATEWVYVGESENIQASLMRYLQTPGSLLMELRPTGFSCEICGESERKLSKQMLVSDLNPVANARPVPGGGEPAFSDAYTFDGRYQPWVVY